MAPYAFSTLPISSIVNVICAVSLRMLSWSFACIITCLPVPVLMVMVRSCLPPASLESLRARLLANSAMEDRATMTAVIVEVRSVANVRALTTSAPRHVAGFRATCAAMRYPARSAGTSMSSSSVNVPSDGGALLWRPE